MFDLSDLQSDPPLPKAEHHWLCTSCRTPSFSSASECPKCGALNFIPYIDRRPLLLSKDVRNSIVNLIDEAAELLEDLDLDSMCFYTGEYMPFLGSLLDDASRASGLESEGLQGYRTTSMSKEELISLFRNMQKPCR